MDISVFSAGKGLFRMKAVSSHRPVVSRYALIGLAVFVTLAIIAERGVSFYRDRIIVKLQSKVMVVGNLEGLIFNGGDEVIRPASRRAKKFGLRCGLGMNAGGTLPSAARRTSNPSTFA